MPSRAVAEPRVTLLQIHKTPTTVAGVWSYTASSEYAISYRERTMRQILIRSTVSTTTFDFKVTDANGVLIRQFLSATGVINDVTPTPVTGDFTLDIFNASPDDSFEVLVKLGESVAHW